MPEELTETMVGAGDNAEPETTKETINNETNNTVPEQDSAADDVLSVFSLSDADAEDDGGAAATADANAEEYKLAFGADSGIPDSLHEPLGKVAQKLGLESGKAASLLTEALAVVREQETALNKQLGLKLREEWGNEFDSRVKATKRFMARMAQQSGLSNEQMAVLMSPNGFRLMDAIRQSVGEPRGIAGNPAHAKAPTVQEQIDAIYNDPNEYAALINPADPRYMEVNDKMNKLLARQIAGRR